MTNKNVKVIKRTRKVNEKDLAKEQVMEIITKALIEQGFDLKDGIEYGMTKGTIIIAHELADVQIKPISPKSGIDRYPVVVYED